MLTVPLVGDTTDEVDETFVLRLTAPAGHTFADADGVATIDDDDGPTLTIGDVTVTEPPPGLGRQAVFPSRCPGRASNR